MSPSYLEGWIRDDIRREANADGALRRWLRVERERFDRPLLERFQLFMLRRTLSYVAARSAFYRRLYAECGFDPSLITKMADLRLVPFTEQERIVTEPYRFACVPMGSVSRIVTLASSGTSGHTKSVLFTESDLRRIAALFAANTKQVLGGKKAIVQIMLPGNASFGQAHLLAKAVELSGSVPVVTGNLLDAAGQIESIVRNGCTALVGYPFYLLRLTRVAGAARDLSRMGVEAIVTAGEHLPSSVKAALESSWNAKIFCHYGLTEMGYNGAMGCGQGIGYHVHEADYIVEVVDPATGEPLDDGDEGELVITSIRREAMPILRYRTGDIAKILTEPCACGSIVKRIGPVARRDGATINLGTEEIRVSCLDEKLFSLPEIVDYRVALICEGSGALPLVLVQTTPESTISAGFLRTVVEEEFRAQRIDWKAGQGVEVKFVQELEPAPKRRAFLSA